MQRLEQALHFSVAAYLRHALPPDIVVWHTPNGEQRDKRTAGKLKGMLVLPGVPDFTILLPNGQASFIELKAAGGGLSPAQIEFRERVLALRCGYATCRSVDEVETTIARWLGAFGRTPRATLKARAA